MGLLMLDQSVALVENGIAVTALLARLDKRVLLAEMYPCRATGNRKVRTWWE